MEKGYVDMVGWDFSLVLGMKSREGGRGPGNHGFREEEEEEMCNCGEAGLGVGGEGA